MRRGVLALGLVLGTGACAHAPSPLSPSYTGSVGMTHRGVLAGGEELPAQGPGYRFLRDNGRHFATARFAHALQRAAAAVDRERPGSMLVVGDISAKNGGQLLPHFSHRAGRDADLLFFWTTVDGAPVPEHGFLHVGADGLAFDDVGKRFLRFDLEREWLLVRSLLLDPEARVQWFFIHENVKAMLLAWAKARGEPTELLWRAEQIMLQPNPGGPHDDHIHVRTACDAGEIGRGCEPFGPERPWLVVAPKLVTDESNDVLASELLRPFPSTTLASTASP
ncbi:MAG TPA: penicillin-insensitive murein endopeptidase [Polyangiaceae bacterium]